jgi:transcriptional regulator with XRE-family HTH domain
MSFLNNEAIGTRLKQHRKHVLKMTCRKFSLAAGIDNSQYAKIESGVLPLTENVLSKIEAAFKNIDRQYILFGTETAVADSDGRKTKISKAEIAELMDAINVAKSILKIMPSVRNTHTPEEQIRLYKAREEKYEMMLRIYDAEITSIINRKS